MDPQLVVLITIVSFTFCFCCCRICCNGQIDSD